MLVRCYAGRRNRAPQIKTAIIQEEVIMPQLQTLLQATGYSAEQESKKKTAAIIQEEVFMQRCYRLPATKLLRGTLRKSRESRKELQ